jgi:hypothetical protein
MMNRRHVLSALALGAAAFFVARPARAQGLIRFHNGSFSAPVLVEVRVGDTLDGATLYGTQKIAKGDSWEVDTSGVLAWWRREATPGANDGRFTAWQRVNTIQSDEKIEL